MSSTITATFVRTRPTSFDSFEKLPIELRIKIWIYALPSSRFINPCGYGNDYVFSSIPPPPVVLQICQESRAAGLKHYRLIFRHDKRIENDVDISWEEGVYVDLAIDIFYGVVKPPYGSGLTPDLVKLITKLALPVCAFIGHDIDSRMEMTKGRMKRKLHQWGLCRRKTPALEKLILVSYYAQTEYENICNFQEIRALLLKVYESHCNICNVIPDTLPMLMIKPEIVYGRFKNNFGIGFHLRERPNILDEYPHDHRYLKLPGRDVNSDSDSSTSSTYGSDEESGYHIDVDDPDDSLDKDDNNGKDDDKSIGCDHGDNDTTNLG